MSPYLCLFELFQGSPVEGVALGLRLELVQTALHGLGRIPLGLAGELTECRQVTEM